ncbi:hypothetical protein HDU96_002915 [Phlyctochytrium bullatum]|nr:hypothetical protein HDU96_002915 [Phlyctochytrium bullatum]
MSSAINDTKVSSPNEPRSRNASSAALAKPAINENHDESQHTPSPRYRRRGERLLLVSNALATPYTAEEFTSAAHTATYLPEGVDLDRLARIFVSDQVIRRQEAEHRSRARSPTLTCVDNPPSSYRYHEALDSSELDSFASRPVANNERAE